MRVLLIEDDPATAQSIELMLRNANLNVYATDLGEEGIDLARLYDYDLILLDLNLPDLSGHEVLRQLRVAKVQTPILILSAKGMESRSEEGTVLGPAQVGVLASLGRDRVLAYRRPVVAVLSTGDELLRRVRQVHALAIQLVIIGVSRRDGG